MWRGVRPTATERHSRLPALLVALVCAASVMWPVCARAAGLVDPRFHFRQLRTPHFVIYFHQGEEPLARRLASLVESVRDGVAASLGGSALPLTHVVLADQSEQANGWATPLPRDIVFLHAAAPSGADIIGRTDDWLRLVFTHEYTHIVHLDRSRGWARLVRGLFGRSALAYPNLSLPAWQIEGIATWTESAVAGEGRWHAGDFRAIERVAARDGRALTLDRANGGLVGWPDGHAQYAAGLGFHGYLANTYGETSLARLADASARQLPFLGSRAFRSVYGRSLGTLWRDYQADLLATTARRSDASGARRLSHVGNLVSGPRFAPADCDGCQADILYSARTPEAYPELRAVSRDGARDRHLITRYLGSTVGFAGNAVVFDQQELRRGVGLYSDLFVLDRRTGDVRALTTESRLQDPDVSRDGRRVAAVRESAGRRELVVSTLEDGGASSRGLRVGAVVVLRGDANAQFSAPRWSPDGTRLAVERRLLGHLPDVAVIDASSGDVLHVLADASSRVVTPAWRPDGRAIVAAADFDERPFDLYEFPLDGGPIRRLTSSDGATWPDVSADGTQLTYAGYGVDGADVFVQPYAALPDEVRELRAPSGREPMTTSADAQPGGVAPSASVYRPLGTLGPTSWSPLALSDADQSRAGLFVFGADVLVRHAYVASLSWLVDGPSVARSTSAAQPDWSVSYAYTRWRPSWFVSASDETVFRTATNEATAERVRVSGTRREVEAGVYLPLAHVRRSAQVSASVVRSDATYRLPTRDLHTALVSTRLTGAVDTSRRYGYGISREHGIQIGSTLELARETLGSDASASTGTVDVRAYLPGAARHQVLALRAAGGHSQGATRAVQTFSAGAVGASPSVVDVSGGALGLFRGDTGGVLAGRQIVVGNAEYRLPLTRIERGYGTWPLLLRQAHASVFVDTVQVRGGDHIDSGWRRAAGVELSLDVVAGFALPFAVTAGTAWSSGGPADGAVRAYVRVGRAF